MLTVLSMQGSFISRTISQGVEIYTVLKYLFPSCKTGNRIQAFKLFVK